MKKFITVATDGSALRNPKGPGGWAWVVDANNWNAGSSLRASNQSMEMAAILRALVDIPSGINLKIQTDSAFCVNMIGARGYGGWMEGWKKKGWRKADGSEPANILLVKKIDEVLMSREGIVELQWVKGHSNNALNNLADRKCTDAAKLQDSGVKFLGGPGFNASTVGDYNIVPASSLVKPYVSPFDEDEDGPVVFKKQTAMFDEVDQYCGSCNGLIVNNECHCSR